MTSAINSYQVTFRNASGGRNYGAEYHSVPSVDGGKSLYVSSSSATNSLSSLGRDGFQLMYANFPYTVEGPEPPDNVHLFPDDDILDYEGSVFQPTAAPTPSPAPTGVPTPSPSVSATPSPAPTGAPSPSPSASATPMPTSAPTPTAAATPAPTSALTPKPTATPTPVPTFPTRQPSPSPAPFPSLPGVPDGGGGDGTATGCALCVNVLLGISAKLDTALWHLECAVALLLILVVFGTMRVVSRWSKGVNVK